MKNDLSKVLERGQTKTGCSYSITCYVDKHFYLDINGPLGSLLETKRFGSWDAARDYLKRNYL